MTLNRRFFFDTVRTRLFGGRLKPGQVEGMAAILDRFEEIMAEGDDRWLAYMLATACHETAETMQPVRETLAASDARAMAILDDAFARGRLKAVKVPYWRVDEDGKSWLGRGFVQLTHKVNYATMSRATGIDLVSRPERAMEMEVAVTVLFRGMVDGLFTGRRLADYFSREREDWTGARRIINGTDRAALIAGYARTFYAGISYS